MLLARWLLISGRELESCAGVSWILNDSSGIELFQGDLTVQHRQAKKHWKQPQSKEKGKIWKEK